MAKRTPLPCSSENCGALFPKCGSQAAYKYGCRCDSCTKTHREAATRYRQANAERERDRKHKWVAENRERHDENKRRYHAANRDQALSRMRDYYENNRESVRAYQRDYYTKNRDTVREVQREYYKGSRENWRVSHLWKRYRLTLDDYERMLAEQGGRCAICKSAPDGRVLSVDHDHACCPGGKSCGECVRSLLCNRCNIWLGGVGDDIALMETAINYLKKHRE